MKKVLIVDDEVELIKSLEAGLLPYKDKFSVLTANNGKQALEELQKTSVDLLVTDLRMPEMDGFELIAHVNESYPSLSMIVMTAFATPKIEDEINSQDKITLLEKPLDLDRLADSILKGLLPQKEKITKSLPTLVQLVAMERADCLLRVDSKKSKGPLGYICIVRGEIYTAVTSNLKGEAAFFDLLNAEDVVISLKKLPEKKITRTINKPLRGLFKEGLWNKSLVGLLKKDAQKKDEVVFPTTSQAPEEKIVTPKNETVFSPTEIGENTTNEVFTIGEELMGKLEDVLGKLKEVDGFMAAGVFTPNGEMAAQVNVSQLKIEEIGSLANDVLLKAQKATDIMNVGRGKLVHIDAPQAHIFARCINDSNDLGAINEAGKVHIHVVLVLGADANLAMAKIKLESVLGELSAAF